MSSYLDDDCDASQGFIIIYCPIQIDAKIHWIKDSCPFVSLGMSSEKKAIITINRGSVKLPPRCCTTACYTQRQMHY
eukprot:scaffold2293_cov81-Skeletonema_dohrnii-CCMP3373.AAC.7